MGPTGVLKRRPRLAVRLPSGVDRRRLLTIVRHALVVAAVAAATVAGAYAVIETYDEREVART